MIDSIKKLIDKYDDKRSEEPDYYFQWEEVTEDLKALLRERNMVKCNNCPKEVDYTVNGLCYECIKRADEVNASLVYPLKIISLLKEILEELKSIKNG